MNEMKHYTMQLKQQQQKLCKKLNELQVHHEQLKKHHYHHKILKYLKELKVMNYLIVLLEKGHVVDMDMKIENR